MIINSATGCGFTPQYDDLQDMYEELKEKGLEILDFPCNKMAEEFFNGGGHKNAAGGRLGCDMEEAISITKKAIYTYEHLLVDKK